MDMVDVSGVQRLEAGIIGRSGGEQAFEVDAAGEEAAPKEAGEPVEGLVGGMPCS